MDNPEDVMMALASLEKEPQEMLPKVLEEYLVFVAKTGNTVFPWPKVKTPLRIKLETVIEEFNKAMPEDQVPKMPNVDAFKFDEMKQRIFEQLDSYSGIPFTMQRLCELLTQPKRHYKRVDKFMRGLEKVMLVVSTVEPMALGGEEAREGQEGGEAREAKRKAKEGRREEEGLAMESPSKRIRLSSAEEEPGPCDSQDDSAQPAAPTNGLTPPSLPAAPIEAEEESMDIDTECTSSETRLSLPGTKEEDKLPASSPCDSGDTGVTTSATPATEAAAALPPTASQEEVGEQEAAVAPSSTGEGEGAGELGKKEQEVGETGAEDCSSSDQAAVAEAPPSSPTNSEAEPAEEAKEESEGEVREEAKGEASPPSSVHSSEEAAVAGGEKEGETGPDQSDTTA